MLRTLAVQQGPGEVMVALKLKFKTGLSGEQLVSSINEFEQQLQARAPEVKWCFVEPDNAD